jgi:DNA-directed RNA polymerase, beta'' subunit/160 kD subunit
MKFFFCNTKFNKKEIQKLIIWFLINHGTKKTSNLIDQIKTISFQYATKSGFSIGIEDLKIPEIKRYLIKNTEKEIFKNEKLYLMGKITNIQRLQKIIDIWNTTNEILTKELIQNFRQNNTLNPVYISALSGARGNISQVKQLVGMRGLMSDSKGEIIDIPIQSNFKEGLNITEYLISCYGARKGLIDTALKTSNSGYLTRKLVDVAQSLIIKQLDCKTLQGVLVTPLIKNKKHI